jgi:hypothetical protein
VAHLRLPRVGVAALLALGVAVLIPTSGPFASEASASEIPLCGGQNFLGGWVGQNGATGTLIINLAFINDGHHTCRLAGYPTIQGYRNGHEYHLEAGHLKNQPFDILPTVVSPRMSGEMVLTTSESCNALNSGNRAAINRVIAKNTYSVSVEFPHSSDPIFIDGLSIDVACSLNITGLGWR